MQNAPVAVQLIGTACITSLSCRVCTSSDQELLLLRNIILLRKGGSIALQPSYVTLLKLILGQNFPEILLPSAGWLEMYFWCGLKGKNVARIWQENEDALDTVGGATCLKPVLYCMGPDSGLLSALLIHTHRVNYPHLLLHLRSRAATSIGNTDFLSVTDFFAQKGGKSNIFRYFSRYFYR